MNKQVPRIVFSPIGKCWYVVTAYREKRGTNMDGDDVRYIVATKKYDVTDQMDAILSSEGRKAVKRGKTPVRVPPPQKATTAGAVDPVA